MSGVLAAGLAAMSLATSAQGATTVYPSGGSTFSGGTDGWVGSDKSCGITLLVVPLPLPNLCTADTVHAPSAGNPPGSISARTDVVLNLASLFSSGSTWTSPEFTVAAGNVNAATFSIDRALSPGGLLSVGLTSTYTVTLHNRTTNASSEVFEEALDTADTDFSTVGAGIEITPGHKYQLSIRTATSSTIGLNLFSGATDTRFDNVRVAVDGGGSGGGPGGPGGPGGGDPGSNPGGDTPLISPGVRIVRGPYSNVEITNLIKRFNINADTGAGADGSLIPLEHCTIIGTSGPDRIVGTRGNDVICGMGGNDVIIAGNGRDLVDGANGADRINGGAGADMLLGLAGNDRIGGDAGADGIGGGAGKDILGGGGGNDRVSGRAGNDRLSGGAGRDRLAGGAGNDTADGGPGADRIAGGAGNDRLTGGPQRDLLLGGPGRDRFAAVDAVRDVVRGQAGRDSATVDRRDRVTGVERVTVRRG